MRLQNIFGKITAFFKGSSKALLRAVYIIIGLVVILQIAVTLCVVWLNSDSGQTLIQTQIDNATQDTGYHIALTPVSYAFPQGLKFGSITVSDEEGAIVEIQDIVIRPSLMGLGMRYFGVSLSADNVTLHRLPKTAEGEEVVADDTTTGLMQPFVLPDIYFTKFGLDSLSIDVLDIREAVFGTPLLLSPRLEAGVGISDILRVDATLRNRKVKGADVALPAWMPERVRIDGRLNPQTLDAHISHVDIRNDAMRMSVAGRANLAEGGEIAMALAARVNDMAAFAEGTDGFATLKVTMDGQVTSPALNANGRVVMPMLKERGLSDIILNLRTDKLTTPPQGVFSTKTTYNGQSVELTTDFAMNDNNVLHLKNITGAAPDITLAGGVQVDLNTVLATGQVTLQAVNLGTYAQLADVDMAGKGRVDIRLTDANAVQGGTVDVTLSDIVYDTVRLGKADMRATLFDVAKLWPDNLNLTVSSLRVGDALAVSKADARLNQNGDDRYNLTLNANGEATMQPFTLNGRATINGLRVSDPAVTDIQLTLASAGSELVVTGQADMNDIDVTAKTDDFALGSLPVALPDPLAQLRMDAVAKIVGAMSAPVITADASFSPVTVTDGASISINVKTRYENNAVRVDIGGDGTGIQTLNGYAALPMALSLQPFVFDMPETTPVDARVTVQARAEALTPLFLPVDHTLIGDLNVNATIGGTIANIDPSGQMTLSSGLYRFNPFGVELRDVEIGAALTADSVRINNLSANDGKGGQLSGGGVYSLNNQQGTRIDIDLKDFNIADSDRARGKLSADLGFRGRGDEYLLSGNINLGQFDIVIPERFQSSIPELNIITVEDANAGENALTTIHLDMHILADNQIFVRGWGLDAEFGGEIDVSGTLNDPQLNGDFTARRGRYEEFGRRFELEKALLRFQGSLPPSPYLDIVATSDAGDIVATVTLSGSVTKPSVALSSVPALPEDEVLARVLFGKNLERITLFQAYQLKQTLDRFTGRGGGGFDAIGMLRDVTGLDDIRVNTDEDGESSVGVGKYLSEDVYLELEKGAGENSGAAKIQVELTPTISLESKIGQDAEAGGGVLWKWDY